MIHKVNTRIWIVWVFKLICRFTKYWDVFFFIISWSCLFEIDVILMFVTTSIYSAESTKWVPFNVHNVGWCFIEWLTTWFFSTTDDRILLITASLWNVWLIAHYNRNYLKNIISAIFNSFYLHLSFKFNT